jgi:hypothetical protein
MSNQMSNQNELNRALYDVIRSLRDSGMTREASQVIAAAERIAANGPELLNSNHITQVGRSELGLHGDQRTKMWETFGPVLGWFRPTAGPARGVPIPQLMPGESMASFSRRCYQWLQQYAQISGQQELMTGMRNYFSMIQQPLNMKQLEETNRKIYDEFSRQFAAAQAKAKQRVKAPTPKT